MLLSAAVLASALAADPVVLDDFDAGVARWVALPADGVGMSISRADAPDGGAMAIEYDFTAGSGFAIARLPLDIALPENFRLSFDVRGEGPPNDLEFKLLGPDAGDTVWWHNRRSFRLPRDWTPLSSRRRHFEFAWGPLGADRPLERISGIEIVVASSSGGRGRVLVDDLVLTPLPPERPYEGTPALRAGDGELAGDAALDADARVGWRPAPEGAALTVDFGEGREFSGLVLEWEGLAPGYAVHAHGASEGHPLLLARVAAGGGTDHLFTPETTASSITITTEPAGGRGPADPATLRTLRVLSVEEIPDRNAFCERVAEDHRRGLYPRNWLREKPFWTIVGVPEDRHEALLSEHGAIEIAKGGPTLEPFILLDGKLLTWADVEAEQSLEDGYLPIPSVRWGGPPVALTVTPVAAGEADLSVVRVRYRLENASPRRRTGSLVLAVRPFQILPQWQWLNLQGGAAYVPNVQADRGGVRSVSTSGGGAVAWRVDARTPADAVAASTITDGDPVLALETGVRPVAESASAESPAGGDASALLIFDFDLPPGGVRDVFVDIPFQPNEMPPPGPRDPTAVFGDALAIATDLWRSLLNRVEFDVPPAARPAIDTVRSQLGYILINADGPGIQPGSRTYERSWIRDGALTGTALLYMGHPEPVRRFIDWYAPHQYPSGKVPCVVDRRGPDPVDEHDSTGQLIYIINRYHDFTGDAELIERLYPAVVRGVGYIQALRGERTTPEFADESSPKHVFYGLVPESISHEGYSAKPMHSYWDDFFVLRGLGDAARLAAKLGRDEDHARFAALEREFRADLYDSMRLAMQQRGIDFIPGCAELGDFDPSSTSIGIYPVGELGAIPEPQLTNTFDRYWEWFVERRDGARGWSDYTPYEVRNIGTMVRLGRPERVEAMLDWFLAERTPPAWNQWAEVGHREPRFPGFVGDLPHTWVGSDYISAVRAMFVYEHERDARLVVAAGLPGSWLAESGGVRVRGLPTLAGPLDLAAHAEGDETVIEIASPLAPPRGIVVRCPGDRPIAGAAIDGSPVPVEDRSVLAPAAPARVVFRHADRPRHRTDR